MKDSSSVRIRSGLPLLIGLLLMGFFVAQVARANSDLEAFQIEVGEVLERELGANFPIVVTGGIGLGQCWTSSGSVTTVLRHCLRIGVASRQDRSDVQQILWQVYGHSMPFHVSYIITGPARATPSITAE